MVYSENSRICVSFLFLFFFFFFFFTLTPIPGVKGDYPYSQLRHNCTSHYLREWLCASWKNTADRADSLTSSLSLTAIDPRYLICTFVLLHTRLYSTFNYFPSFPFFYFIYPYQFSFTLCAFHSTKFPVWNFGNSTCQMERYIPVTQTRPKPPRVSLLFLQAGYKGAVLRTTICQMERGISVQPTEMTEPFKVDRPPSKTVPNILVEPIRNGPFHLISNRNFRNFGLSGKRPLSTPIS